MGWETLQSKTKPSSVTSRMSWILQYQYQASSGQITPSKKEAPILFERKGTYYLMFGHICCFCEQGSGKQIFNGWNLSLFHRVVVYFQGLRNHTVNTKGDTKRPKCHSLFTTVRTLDQNLSRLFDRSSGAFNNPRTSVKKNKCTAPTSLSLEHPINHSRRIGNRRCSTRWAF